MEKDPAQMGLFWRGRWMREVEGAPPISSWTEESEAASDTEEARKPIWEGIGRKRKRPLRR